MLQRVQSIFLLGVALCMGSLLITDIWEETLPDRNQRIELDAFALQTTSLGSADAASFEVVHNTWFIAAFATLSAIVAFYEIFRYKSRLTQLKLGFFNVLLMIVVLGSTVYYIFQGETLSANATQGDFETGIYLPGLALIFNLLANRFIRRDEQLVRSVDRLR
ncbi:MAG: DUF4293 domain-containing protein [Tunicatimonas sp.]